MAKEKKEKKTVIEEAEDITKEDSKAEETVKEPVEPDAEQPVAGDDRIAKYAKAEKDGKALKQKAGKSAKEVNEELIALENEREDYKNALIRERADFENYKKRNAELSANSYQNGVADTVSAILPVLDNFERALQAESADKAFSDGMEMIMRQLLDVMSTLGVEAIDTSGKFDPNVHNAVMQVEDEGCESNDIVECMQKGYALKDRILRYAMVKVNK